jgi:hypothetical protein
MSSVKAFLSPKEPLTLWMAVNTSWRSRFTPRLARLGWRAPAAVGAAGTASRILHAL